MKKKKKQLILGKKRFSLVGAEERCSFEEGGEKKSASGSCPVDFWRGKLASLLRISFKGGFDRWVGRTELEKRLGGGKKTKGEVEKGKSGARHESAETQVISFAWNAGGRKGRLTKQRVEASHVFPR